jgi:hypothetical protein
VVLRIGKTKHLKVLVELIGTAGDDYLRSIWTIIPHELEWIKEDESQVMKLGDDPFTGRRPYTPVLCEAIFHR